MPRLLVLCVALASAAPPSPDVTVSTPAVTSKPEPIHFRLDAKTPVSRGAGPATNGTIGINVGIAEGKPLEMALWGSAGAVAGSVAGPAGAVIGAAAGVAAGLIYSVYVVPHNGPAKKSR